MQLRRSDLACRTVLDGAGSALARSFSSQDLIEGRAEKNRIGLSDDFGDDEPLCVDEESFGNAKHAEGNGGSGAGVDQVDIVAAPPEFIKEVDGRFLIILIQHTNEPNPAFLEGVCCSDQIGVFGATRDTPRRPEVHDDNIPTKLKKRKVAGVGEVWEGEVGGRLPDQRGGDEGGVTSETGSEDGGQHQ